MTFIYKYISNKLCNIACDDDDDDDANGDVIIMILMLMIKVSMMMMRTCNPLTSNPANDLKQPSSPHITDIDFEMPVNYFK